MIRQISLMENSQSKLKSLHGKKKLRNKITDE